MERLNVLLLYPWKFPDSPYYKYLVEFPPKGVNYLSLEKLGVLSPSKKAKVLFLKRLIYKFRNIIQIPNLKLRYVKNVDLVHCAHCENLMRIPWVVDVENYETFGPPAVKKYFGRFFLRKILESKWCKKILPWSLTAKREIERMLKSPEISKKIEVLYPAVPSKNVDLKVRKKEEVNLLFVARYFFDKGGLIVLKVFDFLTRKYENVNCFVRSNPPFVLLKKYKRNKRIRFIRWLSENGLAKLYKNSDIFVYPGFTDTFGFSILEAMSFGIPIVTVDGYARKEIVNEKVGFVVPRPSSINFYRIGKNERWLIKQICEKASILIEDEKLRRKLGRNAKIEIDEGKFSVKKRNKKIRMIYEEAIG